MTFYESALRVLEEAGKPLTHLEITQRSMEKGLLSHVGKTPELTMLARLAAMARRPRDRKLSVTAKDTFALTDWMLPEDAAALAATGVPEPHPEEGLPPLRPIERHPEPSQSNVRGVGRSGDRDHRRRRDEEGRRKRYPPMAEVAFEVLEESGGTLGPQALLEKARAKELCGDELSVQQLLYALVEDNQRRVDAGRKPQFHHRVAEGATEGALWLDAASEAPAGEVQQALCAAAGVPFENGRAVLRVREERAVVSGLSADDLQLVDAARHAVKEARRAQARVFRKRLADLELGAFEKAVVKLLHGTGFREIKVARRSREGMLLTARRKDGSLELRHALRILRGNATIERRHVQELRRELGSVGAQVGLICSAGDVRGDARSEAVGQGALVMIWGSDALAEKFFDAEAGVVVRSMALYDVDEAFFALVTKEAEESRLRREERQRERGGQSLADEPRGPDDAGPEGASAPEAMVAEAGEGAPRGADDEGDEEEGDDEGLEAGAAPTPGAPGQEGTEGGRRRRRRRRRRRGGAGRPEGAPGQAAGVAPSAPAPQGGGAEAPSAAPPVAAPVVAPSSGGGEA